MNLRKFIELFVCKNTIIRLWTPYENGHKMLLTDEGKEVCMEWEVLKGTKQSKYADCQVIGVTDIVCDTCWEAVNIVVRT